MRSFFEISMYCFPVLYTRYLSKILEEGMMVLKEEEKSIGSYLEYCSMQISSFAKSELCTATSIQLVEQWTSIQMLWRESGEMPLINRAVNGVNACWQEPAWVIYCVQILCKPILSNNCFRKKAWNWCGLFVWNAAFHHYKTDMCRKASFPQGVLRELGFF